MTKELGEYYDAAIALKIYAELESFVVRFDEIGEPGELDRLCTSIKRFRGAKVNQAPEDFTEQNLIEPVLSALEFHKRGSENHETGDPYLQRRPSTFKAVEQRKPDYLIEDLGESIACILEAKAINEELRTGSKQQASAQVQSYLEDNTYCQKLRSNDQSLLIGIGTDGFRWSRFVKDIDSGDVLLERDKVDISPVVEAVGRDRGPLPGDPAMRKKECVNALENELVEKFSARNLPKSVQELAE